MTFEARGSSRRILIGAAMALLMPATPHAWSGLGHRITCAIAYQSLGEKERAEVDRLTALYRRPDGKGYRYFTQGCTLADLARDRVASGADGWSRFARFEHWHYFNVPRETIAVDATGCARDCVLYAIAYHGARLADTRLPDTERAEALLLLGHWVADVHQPLHVSFADDRGGGRVGLRRGFYASGDLHSVWDREILAKLPMEGGWWAYAGRLREAIPESSAARWSASDPRDWAQESFDLATTADLGYCLREEAGKPCLPAGKIGRPGAVYQRRFAGEVELRLQKAGVRLAALIRSALAGTE